MKIFFVILMASLLFTGCDSLNKLTSDGKSEQWGSCDDNSTFSAMQDTIRKSFEDKAKTEGLSVSEARAFYSQLKITVDQVRTTKNDPSSTKKFCSGRINISIPVPILQKLEEKYKKANSSELRKDIEDDGWEVNANVMSIESDFDVQPSDDKKWLFTTLTQADVISSDLFVLAYLDQYKETVKTVENKPEVQKNANNTNPEVEILNQAASELMTGSKDRADEIHVMQNSKGVMIHCVSDMSICKTEQEVQEYLNLTH